MDLPVDFTYFSGTQLARESGMLLLTSWLAVNIQLGANLGQGPAGESGP